MQCNAMQRGRIPYLFKMHREVIFIPWESNTQHFAIQDWAEAKDIVMRHIPGILSIPRWTYQSAWLGLTLLPC